MVQVLGQATNGGVYNDHLSRVDLPRDTSTTRTAHQPWCTDCKRKGRELDDDQRCPQCARAAITRAAGEARRAAEEQARVEAEATAKKSRPAARQPATPTKATPPATLPAPAAPTELPMEGKQGQPTTRPSAPRATPTSDVHDTPGRAPGAGSSTHREKNPPAAQETRPAAAGGPSLPVENRQPDAEPVATSPAPTAMQILDAQIDHASALLRTTATHRHPAIVAARNAVVAALEALHLLVELTPSTPTTPTPAQPAPATPAPKRSRSGPPRLVLPAEQIIEAYKAGQTLSEIATAHGCSGPTIGRLLEENGVPRRGAPVPRSPKLIEQVRGLYEDEHLTQVEIGARLGQSTKIVQAIMAEAGIDRRAAKARRGRDNAVALKDRIAELGVTAADIKAWAISVGHLQPGTHRGLPAQALVEKYAAAHRQDVA